MVIDERRGAPIIFIKYFDCSSYDNVIFRFGLSIHCLNCSVLIFFFLASICMRKMHVWFFSPFLVALFVLYRCSRDNLNCIQIKSFHFPGVAHNIKFFSTFRRYRDIFSMKHFFSGNYKLIASMILIGRIWVNTGLGVVVDLYNLISS